MTGLNDSPLAMKTFTVSQAPQVVTPSIDPSSGDVPHTDPLTISTTTDGATIHYTTDGNTPTRSSTPPYTTELEFSTLGAGNYPRTVTIKAFAVKSRHADSGEVSATFTIRDPVAKPSITARDEEENGISTGILTIDTFTISTTPSDATIYYTVGPEGGATDPADPRTAATRSEYTGPVSFGESPLGVGTYTIWAFAEMTGLYDSPLEMKTFTIRQAPQVATPTFNTSKVNVPHTDSLTISTTTRDATIHYTTDGNTPTRSSIPPYTTELEFSTLGAGNYPRTVTIKAFAVKSRHADSGEVSAPFTIRDPVVKPIITAQNEDGDPITTNILTIHRAAISTTTDGATIRYTTDGNTPTDSSTPYTTELAFNTLGAGNYPRTVTIKAIAVKDDIVSELASKTYTVSKPQVATPIINPSSGNVDTSQSLTISSTTGATIHYTRNGDDPSLSTSTPTAYTAPVSFGDSSLGVGTYTIKAFAKKADYTDSTVVEKTFTVRDHTVVQGPIFNPAGGTVAMPMIVVSSDSLAITSGTSGAAIRYTTNGNTPTDSSTPYTTELAFNTLGAGNYPRTVTIKAIAVRSPLTDSAIVTDSAVVSATFTVERDVDMDDDGLIDISSLDMLNNIRFNLAGTSYDDEENDDTGNLGSTAGAPASRPPNCVGRATRTNLCGYELMQNLDFATPASYESGTMNPHWMNNDWRPTNMSGAVVTGDDIDSATNVGFSGFGAKGIYKLDVSPRGGFTAIFEGNGFTINNFYSRSGTMPRQAENIGLFRLIQSTAIIRNVGMTNGRVYGAGTASDSIGGLVGASYSSEIRASYSTGTANDSGGDNNDVGGLVGYSYNSVIWASYNTGKVKGGTSSDNVGGLVGYSNGGSGSIRASYNSGEVNGGDEDGSDNVGGLVGYSDGGSGNIRASYNTGDVYGGDGTLDNVGGLVGSDITGQIVASYNMGNVDSGDGNYDIAGGLVGSGTGTISASYNTGSVTGGAGENDFVGGLVGITASIFASYNTGDVDGGDGDGVSNSVGGISGDSGYDNIEVYNFGTITRTTEETAGFDGTALPDSVTSAADLKDDSTDTTTYAGARWNSAADNTLGAWHFGDNMQDPALVYNDYDGATRTTFPSCSTNNGGYPSTIPGISPSTALTCGGTPSFVGGAANQDR